MNTRDTLSEISLARSIYFHFVSEVTPGEEAAVGWLGIVVPGSQITLHFQRIAYQAKGLYSPDGHVSLHQDACRGIRSLSVATSVVESKLRFSTLGLRMRAVGGGASLCTIVRGTKTVPGKSQDTIPT